MRLPIRPAAVAFAVTLAVAACGVSTSNSPETMSRDNLPEELGGVDPSSTLVPQGQGEIELWFVESGGNSDRLARTQIRGPVNASETVVMEYLLDGPDDELTEEGVTTAIPAETRLTADAAVEGETLVLDLTEDFFEALDRPQAFGQVVLTATEIEGIEAVLFRHDGVPEEATDGDGAEVPDDVPLTADDYQSLRGEES